MPRTECDGWHLITRAAGKAADLNRWQLTPPEGGAPIPLEWSRLYDDLPRCYAFIPKGANRPHPLLLVGHYWGFSVFECKPGLDAANQPVMRRTRCFRGHEGYVTGIAVSADGNSVVTSSRDMTLCGWSLLDWPATHHPQLGAQLLERGGKLVVGDVAAGSAAWEMGLLPGNEILACACSDGPVKLRVLHTTGADWHTTPQVSPPAGH